MVVRIPPPVVFALFLGLGLLLNLPHMIQERQDAQREAKAEYLAQR